MKNTIFLSQLLVFPFKSLLSSREVWLCTSLFYYYKEAKDDVFSSIWFLLVFCNVTNKIRKRTDTVVAFTQEYFRVSYPLGNVSALSMGSGSSKDTHTSVGRIG